MNPIVKRVLLIAASLILIVYVGYQAYRAFSGSTVTEIVESATAYETVDTTGVVFRDETVLEKEADGYFFYTVSDGNRIAKNGVIANVFPTLQDALVQQQLEVLDEEIHTLTSINAQGTANRANLSSINQQISETWLAISRAAASAEFMELTAERAKLLALLNKKQLTIGKETSFDNRLAQLKERRDTLAASYTKATATVRSPVAGYFISTIDGFETLFTTKGVTQITVNDLQHYLDMTPAPVSESVGKVVGDYEWYMACIVPLEQTAFIKKDTVLDVRLPFVTDDTVPAQVAAVNKGEGDVAAVILRCTHMSGELSSTRRETVELRLTAYSGLRIPDKAIHFNEAQEPGVFVQEGNYLTFKKIRVLYHDQENRISVCEKTDGNGFVQLYDRVVTEGEDLYEGKLVR